MYCLKIRACSTKTHVQWNFWQKIDKKQFCKLFPIYFVKISLSFFKLFPVPPKERLEWFIWSGHPQTVWRKSPFNKYFLLLKLQIRPQDPNRQILNKILVIHVQSFMFFPNKMCSTCSDSFRNAYAYNARLQKIQSILCM